MSICKSELLFSPVKEAIHGVHFSVDSLDCELPTEQDLILTCQANKDNYTIAFEGSLTTYSEDSECAELAVNHKHGTFSFQFGTMIIVWSLWKHLYEI